MIPSHTRLENQATADLFEVPLNMFKQRSIQQSLGADLNINW